ncbi:hypothetical protein OTU49_004490, partial [Cherax quadricarinatus]
NNESSRSCLSFSFCLDLSLSFFVILSIYFSSILFRLAFLLASFLLCGFAVLKLLSVTTHFQLGLYHHALPAWVISPRTSSLGYITTHFQLALHNHTLPACVT